jgi:pre-mRNA-splicing factor ISY1
MARNEEKAMAMLNRWVKMKRNLNVKEKGRRPDNPQEAETINECEGWRNNIIREIVKKVSTIQNASLGEHRIRDINDDINRLFKEKTKWEDRIRELGGPDYRIT